MLWDIARNKVVEAPFDLIKHNFEEIISIDFTGAKGQVVIGTDKRVLIWDTIANKLKEAPLKLNYTIEYYKDEREILIDTYEGLPAWDAVANATEVSPFLDHLEEIISVECIEGGCKILIGTEDRVLVWDTVTNEVEEAPLTKQSDDDMVFSAKYLQEQNKALIEGRYCMYTWDLEAKRIEQVLFDYEQPGYYTKDGSKLIINAVTPSRRYHTLAQKSLLWLLWKLTDEQLELLKEATKSWQADQAYELKDDELACYKTLPKELQRRELFNPLQ